MDTMLIILTVIVIVAIILIAIQMLGNQGKSQGVNIHTDENSKIHVSTSGNTLQIQITYESTENRPSDAFLFPEPNPQPSPSGSLDRNFWLKVATYDDLSKEEKNEIDERLARSGFFRREETSVADVMKDDEKEAAHVEMLDNFAGEVFDPAEIDEGEIQEQLARGFSSQFTY